MKHPNLILAGALAAGLALGSSPSFAAGAPIVALPGAGGTTSYGVPAPVLVQRGTVVTYVNLDPLSEPHNVRSVKTDNVRRHASWCSETQRQQSKCPIFYMQAAPLALETGIVLETDKLPVGDYEFYCEPHESMRGVLRVV